MHKLLAISVALLSLNLYGADKKPATPKIDPKTGLPLVKIDPRMARISLTGLEGWGKKGGVEIVIEGQSKDDNPFDVKAINNIIELKLRLAGIKVTNNLSFDSIYINLNSIVVGKNIVGYAVRLRPQRAMFFKYNGKEYTCVNGNSRSYNSITPLNYRLGIKMLMDEIILDYLKANPKKEKE